MLVQRGVQPQVHLQVLLLCVDPADQGRPRELKAGASAGLGDGDGGLDVAAVLVTLVCGQEEDVAAKLE